MPTCSTCTALAQWLIQDLVDRRREHETGFVGVTSKTVSPKQLSVVDNTVIVNYKYVSSEQRDVRKQNLLV